MLEIGKSGSVRGVDALCMAECCDTPQSKEGSNREYKVCLSIRAIVHLLDSPTDENRAILVLLCHSFTASVCGNFARHSLAFSDLFQAS
jgi:hypothetical protein